MALLFLTLGFSLTGYLLPWDQKGYWATKVATNIMGGRPCSARTSRRSWSAAATTATRRSRGSTACTSGSCPALFVLCLAAHVALFRRHGLTPPRHAERRATGKFWPEQLFMDTRRQRRRLRRPSSAWS